MTRTRITFLFTLLLVSLAFVAWGAGDQQVAKYDTGEVVRIYNPAPGVSAIPCNFMSSTATPTTVSIATSATSIGALTAGTRLVSVYPSVTMYMGNSGVSSQTYEITLTSGTRYYISGTEADLEALYFRSVSVAGSLYVIEFGE